MARLPTTRLTPVASPVDTFVTPAKDAVAKPDYSRAESLGALAKGLSSMQPSLEKFMQGKVDDHNEERNAFGYGLNTNRVAWNTMLDGLKKTDPEKYEELVGSNPHVRRGFEKAQLEGAAVQHKAAMAQAMNLNPMVDDGKGGQIALFSDERPGAVANWTNQFTHQWMADNKVNDADQTMVQELFSPKAVAAGAELVNQETRYRNAERVDNLINSVGQGTTQAVHGSLNGTDDWDRFPRQAAQNLATQIQMSIDNASENGVRDFNKLNDQAVTALIARAEELGDPRILSALNYVRSGTGTVANIGKYAGQMEQARTNIMKQQRSELTFKQGQERYNDWNNVLRPWAVEQRTKTREEWAKTASEFGRKNAVRQHEEAIAIDIMANPTKNWTGDADFKALAKLDPGAAARMSSLQSALVRGNEATSDNGNAYGTLLKDLNTQRKSFNSQRITDAFNRGLITSGTMQSMWSSYSRIVESRGANGYTDDKRFEAILKGTRKAISGSEEGEYGASGLDAELAVAELYQIADDWRSNPANANKTKAEFILDMRNTALSMSQTYNPDIARGSKRAQEGRREGQYPAAPANAVAALRSAPHKYLEFDAIFGPGAAAAALTPAPSQ